MHKPYHYLSAEGKLFCRLTNDYLFRVLLQRNNNVLKHLTCSLKHLRPEEVKSVTVQNPIEPGKAMDEKTYIMDIRILLNDDNEINYEMQVSNPGHWPERSLLYLCRMFDQLQKGEVYAQVKAATHIGFLDFTLFPEHPEFYATYRLENVKNHHIYTDKFTLCVVDLNQIDLATEEDKKWQIDYWAALFKASTWEEIKMFAEKNEVMQEAAETLYLLTEDAMVREQCLRRQEQLREWEWMQQRAQRLEAENAQQSETIARQGEELEQKDKAIARQGEELEQKNKVIAQKDEEIENLRNLLAKAQSAGATTE